MAWTVVLTDEFDVWWQTLDEHAQEDIDVVVHLLEARGPHLGFPYSSDIKGCRHTHMRELRVQHAGEPFRILYAFDPTRSAVLLIGGNKVGDKRWYKKFVPIADRLYDQHLVELQKKADEKRRK